MVRRLPTARKASEIPRIPRLRPSRVRRPLNNRHSRCTTVKPANNRQSRAGRPLHNRHSRCTTVIPAKAGIQGCGFPARNASHLRHSVSHRGSYAKVSERGNPSPARSIVMASEESVTPPAPIRWWICGMEVTSPCRGFCSPFTPGSAVEASARVERRSQGATKRGQPQTEDLFGVRARPGYDVVDEARPQRDALVDTPWGRP